MAPHSNLRIGEILILRERIDPFILTRTLSEQASEAQRLVSLLIARGQLDADDGALALSEHLGFPAALQRHLEHRDEDLAHLIPAELGRRWSVVPLGRTRTGGVVIVGRDPTPILAASLEHVLGIPVVLAVTPSRQIERLITSLYGAPESSNGVPMRPLAAVGSRSILDIGDVEPLARPRLSRTVSDSSLGDLKIDLPESRSATPQAFESALDEIDRSITLLAAEWRVMDCTAQHWQAALLLRVSDDTALGYRGRGSELNSVEGIAISIAAPTLLRTAFETGRVATEVPDSAVQARLSSLLGRARRPSAAPIHRLNRVAAILAVGDPVEGDRRLATAKLARLADALGAAYAKFDRDAAGVTF